MDRGDFTGIKAIRNAVSEFYVKTVVGNESNPDIEIPETRDKVTERIGEAAAVLPMLWVAYRGCHDPLVTYTAESEALLAQNPEFPQMQENLSRFAHLLYKTYLGIDNLNNKWYDEYRESRQVQRSRQVAIRDAKGNVTGWNTEFYWETQYYWDEPDHLLKAGIDNNAISDWRNTLSGVINKSNKLNEDSKKSFDVSDGNPDNIYYNREEVPTDSQSIAAFLSYGLTGLAYVYYEECLKLASKKLLDGEIILNDSAFIKRRTLMKLVASSVLSWKVRDAQLAFNEENKRLAEDINAHTDHAFRELDISDEQNFINYFGIDINKLRDYLFTVSFRSDDGAVIGTQDDESRKVLPEMEALRDVSKKAYEEFSTLFPTDAKTGKVKIPATITNMIKGVMTTEKIKDFTESKSTMVNVRHFVNATLLGCGLFGVGVLSELGFKLTDDALRY